LSAPTASVSFPIERKIYRRSLEINKVSKEVMIIEQGPLEPTVFVLFFNSNSQKVKSAYSYVIPYPMD
jgi:hypothetical protein